VAFCDTCAKSVDPSLIGDDGCCPTCGTELLEPQRRPMPKRMWFLIIGTAIYLVWRAYQGIGWLSHHW